MSPFSADGKTPDVLKGQSLVFPWWNSALGHAGRGGGGEGSGGTGSHSAGRAVQPGRGSDGSRTPLELALGACTTLGLGRGPA